MTNGLYSRESLANICRFPNTWWTCHFRQNEPIGTGTAIPRERESHPEQKWYIAIAWMDVSGTRIRCIAVLFLECSNRIGIYVIYTVCVSCPTIVDHRSPMTDLFQTFCFYVYKILVSLFTFGWLVVHSFVWCTFKKILSPPTLSLVLVLLISMHWLTCHTWRRFLSRVESSIPLLWSSTGPCPCFLSDWKMISVLLPQFAP